MAERQPVESLSAAEARRRCPFCGAPRRHADCEEAADYWAEAEAERLHRRSFIGEPRGSA